MLEPGLLRAIPYFSELSDEELNEVEQYFFEESYIRDEIIFLEGDEASSDGNSGSEAKGATGVPVRTLVNFVLGLV